ncbi:MAG: aryl-sulfate sulfotransferase [Lachnospiraceae bacterium]|nr:aryl-sulfate sulfotransferase [Lachnospiraceae bacterium]
MKEAIQYRYETSLIERQTEAEREMLKEFEQGAYTIDRPLVRRNPYLINPLAAVILFETPQERAVTLRVCGKEAAGDIVHTFPASRKHILPVLGLYPGCQNKVELTLYEGRTVKLEIETEALREDAPQLCYMETTPEYMRDQMIFVTPSLNALAAAFDYRGDIRWHFNVPLVFDLKRLKNGNILIGTERVLKMPYYMSGLYEMSMVGKIVKEYKIPGGYHHDTWEMEDGNLLVLSEDETFETVEDVVVLLDRETGAVLRSWDLKKILTPGEGPSGGYTDRDWFHNNAIWYDEKNHTMTLSGRHVDGIVNIDYETGQLNWIMGDPRNWPKEKQKYFFKPDPHQEFDWHYEQHACMVTTDGDVMCFDNGHYRSKLREEFRLNKDNFSRGVRYHINREDGTVKQVWQYGKERGQEFFSSYIGNVECYQEGHYMVHSGGIQYYKEEASEHPAALMQGDPDVRAESITVELLHDQKMMELKLKGNYYRAEKLRLYHDQDNLPIGAGVVVGQMGVTPQSDTLIPMESCGEMLPYRYEAKLVEEEDRFTFKAVFEGGQLVMLMLENEAEEHGYFISTSKNKFTALCCGTFIEKDPRNVSLSVNKQGLSGTYNLRMIVDDKKYETGIRIVC